MKTHTIVDIGSRGQDLLDGISHRGGKSAGFGWLFRSNIMVEKGFGKVIEAISKDKIVRTRGTAIICQVRYGTTGADISIKEALQAHTRGIPYDELLEKEKIPALKNTQPFYTETARLGRVALVHNGNLTNAKALKLWLQQRGVKFDATSDTEIIIKLICYYVEHKRKKRFEAEVVTAINTAMKRLEGAYSCILLTREGLYAFRDQYGFRPLKIAETNDSFIFASEPCAWHGREAQFYGNVGPGKIIRAKVGSSKLQTFTALKPARHRAFCIFEDIYLQAGYNEKVSKIRKLFGQRLFDEHPLPGIVIPILKTGEFAALGYRIAQGKKFPGRSDYWPGLYRNPAIGRTFLEPNQKDRISKNKRKYFPLFAPIEEEIRGLIEKDGEAWLIFIDDSLVRSNVARTLIKIVRTVLKNLFPDIYQQIKIAWLLSSPQYTHPCYYGVDTYKTSELIAHRFRKNVEKIRRSINASYLGYLSLEATLETAATVHKLRVSDFCCACFSGKYPTKTDKNQDKQCLS